MQRHIPKNNGVLSVLILSIQLPPVGSGFDSPNPIQPAPKASFPNGGIFLFWNPSSHHLSHLQQTDSLHQTFPPGSAWIIANPRRLIGYAGFLSLDDLLVIVRIYLIHSLDSRQNWNDVSMNYSRPILIHSN